MDRSEGCIQRPLHTRAGIEPVSQTEGSTAPSRLSRTPAGVNGPRAISSGTVCFRMLRMDLMGVTRDRVRQHLRQLPPTLKLLQ
jgi:hypothetical protein